jgi:gliding motility-associated-like protein
VGNPVAIGTGPTINVTPPAAGANYTCRFIYPICNAGWSICNASAGPGPDTVFVQPGPPIPTIGPISYSDTICFNGTGTYSVPNLGYIYNWSAVGNIISGQGTDMIDVDWNGIPSGFVPGGVMVTAIGVGGCQSLPIDIDLTIYNVIPTISQVGPFCSDEEFVTLTTMPIGGILSGSGLTGNDFYPTLADTNLNTITYTYSQSGCSFDTTISIMVYEKPTLIELSSADSYFEICELDSINQAYTSIWSVPGFNEWSVNGGAPINTDILNVTWYWDSVGFNTITVIHTANGCPSLIEQILVVIEECPQTLIWIPNAFTPNGDEDNNTWQPVFTDGYDPQDFSLIVMNRWGETIWESHNANESWDGTYRGTLCPSGIYVYKITYGNDKTSEKNVLIGHITMIE